MKWALYSPGCRVSTSFRTSMAPYLLRACFPPMEKQGLGPKVDPDREHCFPLPLQVLLLMAQNPSLLLLQIPSVRGERNSSAIHILQLLTKYMLMRQLPRNTTTWCARLECICSTHLKCRSEAPCRISLSESLGQSQGVAVSSALTTSSSS
eukprot:XP_001708170.1 Hypothetical protein GL50803_89789 [Giardia lamblia ATCC 50803]